ncbi:MAG: caspase family protein [Burkholderiales bacterium]
MNTFKEFLNQEKRLKRRALIIGCPDDKITGVNGDMKNYKDFLISPRGGLWDESEITVLKSPTSEQIAPQITKLSEADYSFLVFSGHGFYSQPEGATMLQLRPDLFINENKLYKGALRRTIIFDACQEIENYRVPRHMLVEAALEHFKGSLDIRQIYDEQIMKCSEGMVKMYGCKITEASHDVPDEGGLFSIALLNAAKRLSSDAGSIISVLDAFMDAKEVVSVQSAGDQNPTGYFSRTLPHFPFAVSL